MRELAARQRLRHVCGRRDADRPVERARQVHGQLARDRERGVHAADLRELDRRGVADAGCRARIGDRVDALVGREPGIRALPQRPHVARVATGCSASSSGPIASQPRRGLVDRPRAVRVHPDPRSVRHGIPHRPHLLDVAVDAGLELEGLEAPVCPLARLAATRRPRPPRASRCRAPAAPVGAEQLVDAAPRPPCRSRSKQRQLDREPRLRGGLRPSTRRPARRDRARPGAPTRASRQRSRSVAISARVLPPRSASGAASPRPTRPSACRRTSSSSRRSSRPRAVTYGSSNGSA